MELVLLTVYPNRYWGIGLVEIWKPASQYKDAELIEEVRINKFYEVTDDFIFIYDETGGSGYGYKKGDLLRKISLEGREFKTQQGQENG